VRLFGDFAEFHDEAVDIPDLDVEVSLRIKGDTEGEVMIGF